MRVKMRKRLACAAALCVIAAGSAALGSARYGRAARASAAGEARLVPVYSVKTDRRAIALTLNAAEYSEDLYGILDALDEAGVKATFFALGVWVERYPAETAEIAARGHAVENHSDKHPHMNQQSGGEIAADIAAAGAKIEKITGRKPKLFRAPYGEYDDDVVRAARGLGYEAVQWSADSIDWRGEGAETVSARVLRRIKPGGIVLLHTNSVEIVETLERVIEGAAANGYEIVPLSELMLPPPYTIDALGVQKPAA